MAKACPILTSAQTSGFTACAEDDCMWFIHGKCAIVILTEKTEKENSDAYDILSGYR